MILNTCFGEFLLYFIVILFSFQKKKKTVLQDCWCLSCLTAEGQFQWVRDCKSRLNLNPMEERQYGENPKTRCVKFVPKCASARVAPSNIVYLKYGYRSTGKGELITEVLLFRQYLNK